MTHSDSAANSSASGEADLSKVFGTMFAAWLVPGAKELAYASEHLGVDGYAVLSLHLDDQGHFWAGSDNGLYKLDGSGRVVGIIGRDEKGHSISPRATFTVGADGVNSRVAREVHAEVTRQRWPLSNWLKRVLIKGRGHRPWPTSDPAEGSPTNFLSP